MADEGFDFDRFIRARAGVYPRALAELRAGEKVTHWMWFVFPQVLGLGHSDNARLYAISGLAEAQAYAVHNLLGPRLIESTEAMLGWAGRRTPLEILGVIDAMKFHSSMTLFDKGFPGETCFAVALAAFFDGKRDQTTLEKLTTKGGVEA